MTAEDWYRTINQLLADPKTSRQDILHHVTNVVTDRELSIYDKGYVLVGFSNNPKLTRIDQEICMIGAEFETEGLTDVKWAKQLLSEVARYLRQEIRE